MASRESWRDVGRRQGEAISRRQLVSAGVTRSAIEHRVKRGELHVRHPGVFAIGRSDLDEYGRAWAAYLATRGLGRCGHSRALTARSSAALVGLLPYPVVHQVVVLDAELRVPGVTTTRTRSLPDTDLLVDRAGLVVTDWPRMLLDLALSASVAELEDVVDRIAGRGDFDLTRIDARIADAEGRATRKLLRVVEPYRGLSPGEHRSLLERIADRTLVRAGLPRPEVGGALTLPDGREILVDLLYRDRRVAIEIDGRTWHARAAAFESDRVRDRQLQLLGFLTPRFVWWEVRRAPQIVVADVRGMLLGVDVPRRAATSA